MDITEYEMALLARELHEAALLYYAVKDSDDYGFRKDRYDDAVKRIKEALDNA